MKNRKFLKTLVIMTLTISLAITAIFGLAACGKKGGGLSGKYISTSKNSEGTYDYYEFKKGSDVTISESGINYSATYEVNGDRIIFKVTAWGTDFEMEFTLSEDKMSFSDNEDTFVKEGTPAPPLFVGEVAQAIAEKLDGVWITKNYFTNATFIIGTSAKFRDDGTFIKNNVPSDSIQYSSYTGSYKIKDDVITIKLKYYGDITGIITFSDDDNEFTINCDDGNHYTYVRRIEKT